MTLDDAPKEEDALLQQALLMSIQGSASQEDEDHVPASPLQEGAGQVDHEEPKAAVPSEDQKRESSGQRTLPSGYDPHWKA